MTFLQIISLIMIGLSLSIDAFSLSLSYGLLDIKKKDIIRTSLIVGLFHFIMPLLGNFIGKIITDNLNINNKYILMFVLIMILIEMIKSINEEEKEYNLTIIGSILFAFLVSIDSLTIGIGINYITNKIIMACTVFSSMSIIFTLLGFILGKNISNKRKKKSKYIGIILIFTVIAYYLCKA